jgi:hypothetical protein
MIKYLSLVLVLPVIANCSSIANINGKYDRKEDINNNSKIVIDLTKTAQEVDRKFYGSNFDSYSQMPSKELVDELQLGKIRVGGNEFDVNNWKTNKTVTSSAEIKDVISFEKLSKTLTSYNVDGIFQINLTGFQPELVGKDYVIKRTFTADSAYEMVKYLNGKLNLKIVDFSLGNEFSIWNETHSKVWPTDDGITADEYIDRYVLFAIAVRKAQAEVNGNPNSIKLWGPEISNSWYDWNTGNFKTDCLWTDVKGQVACTYGNGKFDHFLPYFFYRLKLAEKNLVLNPKGYKLLDYMAIHYYPNFRTKNSDPTSVITNSDGHQLVAEMLESTRVLNDPSFKNKIDVSSFKNFTPNILGRTKEWMKQYYPDAKLAMNEFAVDSDYRSVNYHPIIRPLFLADVIGILTKENVAFFNQFMLSSGAGSNLPWTMIEGGVRKDMFYMYKLFTNNFKGTIVSVEDNLGDVVNAYATVQNDIINLAIVNKDPVTKTVQIYVKNGDTKKLTTYVVPAWSASILKIEKNPGVFTKNFEILLFGAKEMGIPLDSAYIKKNLN